MDKMEIFSCEEFFLKSLESLKPENLLNGKLQFSEEQKSLKLDGDTIDLDNGCYLVGFGKAVLGLGAFLANQLGKNINSGVLSVPLGTSEIGNHQELIKTCEAANVKIHEGAKDNLPDENSHNAAKAIVALISNLTEKDLVIVLISGGGSALLPFPVEGLSLEEKLQAVRQVSCAGASITELNTVRKALSRVKGGKLAEIIHPAKVITLVLSDIIGDPLDFIASGPTIENNDDPQAAFNIVKKYNLVEKISENVVKILLNNRTEKQGLASVKNIIIGNNSTALQYIQSLGEKAGTLSTTLSAEICGEARDIGICFAELVWCICSGKLNLEDSLAKLCSQTCQHSRSTISSFRAASSSHRTLAIFAGGETTVTVSGSGRGGRNQEMVLSFGIVVDEMRHNLHDLGFEVEFLSCGTDGIDGPTDSAGAVWHMKSFDIAKKKGLDPQEYLANNDSYNFWKETRGLVNTGHTGTNVMDIQVLMIKRVG